MSKINYLIKEWIVPIVVALIIVFFLNKFVFVLVTVPTGSMLDTIEPGDKLFVSKLIDEDNLERKDIVVFDSEELDKILVKRLIGLPGDKIYIDREGTVYINEEKLEETYAIKSTQKPQEFLVPENSFFFLGDNRPNSRDARYWENPFIDKKYIMGKVVFRFFPFTRIGRLN